MTIRPQLSELARDFSKLCSEKYGNAWLVSSDGSKISVNLAVISVRCPALAERFGEVAGSSNPIIHLDIEAIVLMVALKYIHAETISLNSVDKFKLFAAAHKLSLMDLKQPLKRMLLRSISRENAIELFVLSKKTDEQEIEDAVISFLQRDRHFLDSEKWIEFKRTHQSLYQEVLEKLWISRRD